MWSGTARWTVGDPGPCGWAWDAWASMSRIPVPDRFGSCWSMMTSPARSVGSTAGHVPVLPRCVRNPDPARVYLGVSRMVLMADLVDSQRLYGQLGDRSALAYVDAHLQEAERLVTEGGGVRVKTVGDSIVAAFDAPGAAAAVAMCLQEHYGRGSSAQGVAPAPGLRVGVAAGPALAARSDAAGLDWCGGTASRAVHAARSVSSGEIGLTATVAAVAPPLAGWSVSAEDELTVLRRAAD